MDSAAAAAVVVIVVVVVVVVVVVAKRELLTYRMAWARWKTPEKGQSQTWKLQKLIGR